MHTDAQRTCYDGVALAGSSPPSVSLAHGSAAPTKLKDTGDIDFGPVCLGVCVSAAPWGRFHTTEWLMGHRFRDTVLSWDESETQQTTTLFWCLSLDPDSSR